MKNENLHNVLLVTLDSCRVDSALKAQHPFLDTISPEPAIAETDGTYTYAAHHAFFSGRMPRRLDGQQLIGSHKKIWVSSTSKSHNLQEAFELTNSANLAEHYRAKGHQVVGVGGVQFFNPYLALNMLPKMFPEFYYYGAPENIPEPQLLPRGPRDLPMAHAEEIAQKIGNKNPFFLFINSSETHLPFDTPATQITPEYTRAITHFYDATRSKQIYEADARPVSEEERGLILDAQVRAVEWVDSQLAILVASLPKKFPTLCVIMGDHGEEVGENGRYGHGYPSPQVMQIPLWATVLEN